MPLPLLQPTTGRCKATCPSGSYADPSGVCMPCDASCAACTGPSASSCSSCDPIGVASHLRVGACVDSCGGGFYAEDQPLVRTCQTCHASCQARAQGLVWVRVMLTLTLRVMLILTQPQP